MKIEILNTQGTKLTNQRHNGIIVSSGYPTIKLYKSCTHVNINPAFHKIMLIVQLSKVCAAEAGLGCSTKLLCMTAD